MDKLLFDNPFAFPENDGNDQNSSLTFTVKTFWLDKIAFKVITV